MAMTFPANSVYTSNSYRIPVADLTAYSTVQAHRNLPGRTSGVGENLLTGSFHKDRLFGHFATFVKFTTTNGKITVSRLDDGFPGSAYNAEYPSFWRNAGRTNGVTNRPLGYAHHFAEVGPSTAGDFIGVFIRNGRAASNTSGASETLLNVSQKDSNGRYIITNNIFWNKYGSIVAHRTPFHPRYNVYTQTHDYPRALYSNEPNFQIIDDNGSEVNPLSSASTRGSRAGFKFSVFRHYGQFSTRDNGVINIVRPANPSTNPAAIAQGGWGHDYLVTSKSPISRRNWNTSLDRIKIDSPYGDAFRLDFLNGTRYNQKLSQSSIWSK